MDVITNFRQKALDSEIVKEMGLSEDDLRFIESYQGNLEAKLCQVLVFDTDSENELVGEDEEDEDVNEVEEDLGELNEGGEEDKDWNDAEEDWNDEDWEEEDEEELEDWDDEDWEEDEEDGDEEELEDWEEGDDESEDGEDWEEEDESEDDEDWEEEDEADELEDLEEDWEDDSVQLDYNSGLGVRVHELSSEKDDFEYYDESLIVKRNPDFSLDELEAGYLEDKQEMQILKKLSEPSDVVMARDVVGLSDKLKSKVKWFNFRQG